jgi:putative endonuclease
MHTHHLGRLGEELAEAHFTRLGFATLARNVRTHAGEIDLVVFNGRVLVFAEIKSRAISSPTPRPDEEPLTGLRPRQRARLRRLACAWLHTSAQSRPHAETIRFDAVGVTVDNHGTLLRLDHIENAF